MGIDSNISLNVGTTSLHLGAESPLISKHHLNWRLQAMEHFARRSIDDLHYSSVVSLSEKDVVAIKEKLVALVGEVKQVVRESKEERLQCFALDFLKCEGSVAFEVCTKRGRHSHTKKSPDA